jgi:hypothetical protein
VGGRTDRQHSRDHDAADHDDLAESALVLDVPLPNVHGGVAGGQMGQRRRGCSSGYVWKKKLSDLVEAYCLRRCSDGSDSSPSLPRYLVLTVSVPGLTATVVPLSTTHGVELSEIVGGAATVVGVVAIWGG